MQERITFEHLEFRVSTSIRLVGYFFLSKYSCQSSYLKACSKSLPIQNQLFFHFACTWFPTRSYQISLLEYLQLEWPGRKRCNIVYKIGLTGLNWLLHHHLSTMCLYWRVVTIMTIDKKCVPLIANRHPLWQWGERIISSNQQPASQPVGSRVSTLITHDDPKICSSLILRLLPISNYVLALLKWVQTWNS